MKLEETMEGVSILQGEFMEQPDPPLVHHIFQTTVQNSHKVALVNGLLFEGFFLSYDEVNSLSNKLARLLAQHLRERYGEELDGGQSHLVVAVDMVPSHQLPVALLAILKLGVAYMPVDSQSAINRVKFILNEASPVCILADSKSVFCRESQSVWSRFFVLNYDDLIVEIDKKSISDNNLTTLEMITTPSLMAVVYTSGSTGTPKGVCLTHRTAINRLVWQWQQFPFTQDEVGCFKTSLLFVDSIVEIFSCVLKLQPLAICPAGLTSSPEGFVDFLEHHRVSRLVLVPSMLRNLLFWLSVSGGGEHLPDLSLWISNSETLRSSLLLKFFDTYPHGKTFCNFYGSTETMADVTWEVFHGQEDVSANLRGNDLSIGKPMSNSNAYIVDDEINLKNKGEFGEICVSGLNVADGYLGGESVHQPFISNPFDTSHVHRILYRTGDFGRMLDDKIIYEGRRDLQVKIRGQRVNISEIEKVVQNCAFVEKVVVLCHRFSEISNVIVAYYTMSPNISMKRTKVESTINDAVRKSLPTYMRPKLLLLEEVPLQHHTGKVDRVALRKLYEKAFNRQSSQELAVLDEKGRKAVNIIALNLSMPASGLPRNSSFFELGGNSVSMISTIVQLREYGLHIPIEAFSSARTIQEIVDHVTEAPAPIGETLPSGGYVISELTTFGNGEVIMDTLTESFIEKEPLDVLLGVTKSEFRPFALSLYEEAVKTGLSLVVLDRFTGDVVGGDFLFDYFTGVQVQHHESMAPILGLLHQFEEPVKERMRRAGVAKLLFNFCLFVHKDLPHPEQVRLCHLIEGHVLRVAREHGFYGVITNNTNPVTQDICEHFYDYQLLEKFLVRDFDFNGRKVFGHAPEDYCIKMMIKYL